MTKKAGTYLRVRGEIEALADYSHGEEVECVIQIDRVEIVDEQNGEYVKICKGKLLSIKEKLGE